MKNNNLKTNNMGLSNTKVNIKVLEKHIRANSDDIRKLDEKRLPDVLIELRIEQYAISDKSIPAKEITEIDIDIVQTVFVCWSFDDLYEKWIEAIIAESAAL